MTGRIHSQAGTKQSDSSSTKGTALPSSKAFAISLCARQRCTIWRAFFFYLSLNWTSLFLFKKPGKTSFIIILLFQFCRIMYTKKIPAMTFTYILFHGLQTPSEEIDFNARTKIHSQIFRYGKSIFLSAAWAQIFKFLRFRPSLGVRSPCFI